MMVGTVSRLSANNAAFNCMRASNSIMNMAFRGSNMDRGDIFVTEKNLQSQMLNDSLMYKANSYMEDSFKKLQKEKIKRTFSIFA